MSWVELALLLLRVANSLIAWQRESGQIESGKDEEIAKQSALILKQTASAKKIMEEISGLSGSSVDVLLRQLEPADPGK